MPLKKLIVVVVACSLSVPVFAKRKLSQVETVKSRRIQSGAVTSALDPALEVEPTQRKRKVVSRVVRVKQAEPELEPELEQEGLYDEEGAEEDDNGVEIEEVVTTRRVRPKVVSQGLRQKRLQTENATEGLLEQKLESMRLKDEERRMKQLLNAAKMLEEAEKVKNQPEGESSQQGVATMMAPAQVETVGQAPVLSQGQSVQLGDQLAFSQSALDAEMTSAGNTSADASRMADLEESSTSISPFGGLPLMTNERYDVIGKYTAGLGVLVDVSEHIGLGGSYSYSQLEVNDKRYSTYPYAGALSTGQYLYDTTQHNFELDGVYRIFRRSKRIQPYAGLGLNYVRSNFQYNSDHPAADYLKAQSFGRTVDVTSNAFGGNVQAGADFFFSKHLSVGAGVKLIKMFTSTINGRVGQLGYAGSSIQGLEDAPGAPRALENLAETLSEENLLQLLFNIKYTF